MPDEDSGRSWPVPSMLYVDGVHVGVLVDSVGGRIAFSDPKIGSILFARQQAVKRDGWMRRLFTSAASRGGGAQEGAHSGTGKWRPEWLRNRTDLLEAGWLVPERQWIEALQEPCSMNAKPMTSTAIMTRGRPLLCVRALRALQRQQGEATARRIVVVDDSRSWEHPEATEAALQAIAHEESVYYINRPSRLAFAAECSKRLGLEPDLLSFALLGYSDVDVPSFGASLNAMMLECADERVISLDDDMVADAVVETGSSRRLSFSTDGDPTVARYFADPVALAQECPQSNVDWTTPLERVVGCPVHMLASALGASTIALTGMDGRMSVALARRSVAALCTLGVAGDPGTWSHRDRLLLTGDSRKGLVKAYPIARSSRHVLRSAPSVTVSSSPFFMSGAFGCDLEALRMPFSPVFRNQDGVFGTCVARCYDDVLTVHMPWAVRHDPPVPRVCQDEGIWTDGPLVRMADIVLAAVMTGPQVGCAAASPSDRRDAIGRGLAAVGSLRIGAFEEWLQNRMCAHWLWRTRQLVKWAGEVQAQCRDAAEDAMRQAELTAKATHEPVSIADVFHSESDRSRTLATAQKLLRDLGQLMSAWDAIVDEGTRMRDGSERLARRLC